MLNHTNQAALENLMLLRTVNMIRLWFKFWMKTVKTLYFAEAACNLSKHIGHLGRLS